MDSRERGEPPPLCAEEAEEYGEGGRSCGCAAMVTCGGERRTRECGRGDRDARRRLRICWLEEAPDSRLCSGIEDAERLR